MSNFYFTSMYDRLKTGRRRSKNQGELVSAYDAAIQASLRDIPLGSKHGAGTQSGDSVSEASSSPAVAAAEDIICIKQPTKTEPKTSPVDKRRKRGRKPSGKSPTTSTPSILRGNSRGRKRKSELLISVDDSPTTSDISLKKSNKVVSQTALPGTEIQPEDLGAIKDQVREVEIVRDENGDEVKIFWIQAKFRCHKEMRAMVPRVPRLLLRQDLSYDYVLNSFRSLQVKHNASPELSDNLQHSPELTPKTDGDPTTETTHTLPSPPLTAPIANPQKLSKKRPRNLTNIPTPIKSPKSATIKEQPTLASKILKTATLLVADASSVDFPQKPEPIPLVSPPLDGGPRCASVTSQYISPSSHASSVTHRHQHLIDALQMSDESELSSDDDGEREGLLDGIEEFSTRVELDDRKRSDESSASSSLEGTHLTRDPSSMPMPGFRPITQQLLYNRMESSSSSGLGKSPDNEQQQLLLKQFTANSTSKTSAHAGSATSSTMINVTNSLARQSSLLNSFCNQAMETDETQSHQVEEAASLKPNEIEIVDMLSGVIAGGPPNRQTTVQLDSSGEFQAPKSVDAIIDELSAVENKISTAERPP